MAECTLPLPTTYRRDDLLAFHLIFGRTVADISLNAVANLGYAVGKFGVPLYPGDTIIAQSKVIGLKENSNHETGIVYVHSVGRNQAGEVVLDYVRWVMVRKRRREVQVPVSVPELAASVAPGALVVLGEGGLSAAGARGAAAAAGEAGAAIV